MFGFFFKLFVWQKEAVNCDQSDLCLGHLPYDPCHWNSPCLSVHGWDCAQSSKKKHKGSKDTETNMRLEGLWMHNACKRTTLSTLSTLHCCCIWKNKTYFTKTNFFFFILSLATIPSNHSSLQIILFFKLVMYFCALRQSTKSRFGKFLSISFPDPNLLLQTYINLIY